MCDIFLKLIGSLLFNSPFNGFINTTHLLLNLFYIILCFLESSKSLIALRTNKRIFSRASETIRGDICYLHRLTTRSGEEDRLHFLKRCTKKRLCAHQMCGQRLSKLIRITGDKGRIRFTATSKVESNLIRIKDICKDITCFIYL